MEDGQFTYYFADREMPEGYADFYLIDGNIAIEKFFDYANSNCVKQRLTICFHSYSRLKGIVSDTVLHLFLYHRLYTSSPNGK
jgi:hypothetical protein